MMVPTPHLLRLVRQSPERPGRPLGLYAIPSTIPAQVFHIRGHSGDDTMIERRRFLAMVAAARLTV
jgi:hypothetical protein